MADEITLNANLEYADSEGSDEAIDAIVNLLATVSSKKYTKFKVSVGFAAEEAIPLAECTAPGWCFLQNLDETNFVDVRVSTGGAKFAKLKPGEFCLLRLGSGAQVPYWIADTGACQCQGFIINT